MQNTLLAQETEHWFFSCTHCMVLMSHKQDMASYLVRLSRQHMQYTGTNVHTETLMISCSPQDEASCAMANLQVSEVVCDKAGKGTKPSKPNLQLSCL